MKTSIRSGERYFGVEFTPDGRLVVAERTPGRPAASSEFPSGKPGVQALRDHIEHEREHAHVCIKACGAAALGLVTALAAVPGLEVTLVPAQALRGPTLVRSAQDTAAQLARLAERLF